MRCRFYVGQKVVCVDAGGPSPYMHWDASDAIFAGEVYTLKSVHLHRGIVVVWLEERERHPLAKETWGPESGYGAYRFRPVTDITLLQEIASGIKQPGGFNEPTRKSRRIKITENAGEDAHG